MICPRSVLEAQDQPLVNASEIGLDVDLLSLQCSFNAFLLQNLSLGQVEKYNLIIIDLTSRFFSN